MGANPHGFDSAEFTWNLAEGLVMPLILAREKGSPVQIFACWLQEDYWVYSHYQWRPESEPDCSYAHGANNEDGGACDINPEASDDSPQPYKVTHRGSIGY